MVDRVRRGERICDRRDMRWDLAWGQRRVGNAAGTCYILLVQSALSNPTSTSICWANGLILTGPAHVGLHLINQSARASRGRELGCLQRAVVRVRMRVVGVAADGGPGECDRGGCADRGLLQLEEYVNFPWR